MRVPGLYLGQQCAWANSEEQLEQEGVTYSLHVMVTASNYRNGSRGP